MQVELLGVEEFQRTLQDVGKRFLPTANARAINLVLRKMRTRTVRTLSSEMGLKQKTIRSRVVVSKKASRTSQQGVIEYRGKALNLVEFKARQTAAGVTARPWSSRHTYLHAFIATMPQGGRIVVIRQKGAGGGLVGRLPIRAMLGPGIAKTAATDELARAREETMREVYPVELKRQLDLLLSRAVAKRSKA